MREQNASHRRLHLTALALALLLVACTAAPPPTISEVVGPLSGQIPRAGSTAGEGHLEVRTRKETIDDGGIGYRRYTPYSIYTPEGRRVKGVQNHVGPTDQSPMIVRLPAGQYVVYAWAEGAGRVGIPVVIVNAQLTQVNLEFSGMALPADLATSPVVRLPNGRIIGRKAMLSSPSK